MVSAVVVHGHAIDRKAGVGFCFLRKRFLCGLLVTMLAPKCAHGSNKRLLLACTIFLEVSRSAHGCVSPHHVQQLQSQKQVRHVTRSPFVPWLSA